MTIKEKNLHILSLAMDINEKYGNICFFEYHPHTCSIVVYLCDSPWNPKSKLESHIVYLHDIYKSCKNLKTQDDIISMLESILENGLKK